MIYSKTCEYAIRSLICFVGKGKDELVTVKEVFQRTKVPQAYVAKIFQCLVDKKILRSQRGPKGGFSLLIAPEKLCLMDIVNILDNTAAFSSHCSMGLEQCQDDNPCPLHATWSKAKQEMIQTLSNCTIKDISNLVDQFGNRKAQRSQLSDSMRGVFKTPQ